MQRREGNLPLLRKQIQLLADNRRTVAAVCRCSSLRNAESGTASNKGQPLPSVHEELVGTQRQLQERSLLPKTDMEKDKFINLFCVWWMGESGWPEFYRDQVSSPGV